MASEKILSNLQCRDAEPREKQYYLNDGGGLRLQIKPDGKKIWVFRYMLNKKSKETTFKHYPKTTLKEAREQKDKYKRLISENIDPIEYFRKQNKIKNLEDNSNFEKVMYEWLAAEKSNASENQYKWKVNRFEKDVLPHLKNLNMNEIDVDDIETVIRAKDKTAPETASKLFSYMKRLFSYARLKRYCDRNVLLEIDKSHLITKKTVKHMPKITDQEIFKELVNSIYSYHGGFSVKNALKLVLHIPLRAENLCTMKWSEIDFEKKTLTIPREQMKLKNPNIKDFVMPLSNEVISILKEQKKELSNYTNELDYVFVGANNRNHINKESPNKALQLMDFNNEKKGRRIRLHGFRGTIRSFIDTLDKEGKFTFETKERFLDHHEKNKVVRAYSHGADFQEQLKELTNWWSCYIVSLKDKVKK